MCNFSIITVIYNAKDVLEKTLNSIQNQAYKDFEVVIVDGNSTDGTKEYIESLLYDNINFISEKDNGIYDAMNKGIDLAKGKYLIFLNAGDNFSSDDVLQNIASNIEDSKILPKIVYGGANVYSTDGEFLSSLKPLDFTKSNLNRYATRTVCHQSIFVHKKVIVKYSDKYRLKGELNWYYDLQKSVDKEYILKVDDIICDYYLGGTGDTHFMENNIERIKVTYEQNSLFSFVLSMPFFMIPFIFRLRRIILGK